MYGKKISRRPSAVMTAVFMFVLPFCCLRPAWAGSASAVLNFSAVFVGGGCDISTSDAEIIFGGGDPIMPSDIISSPPQASFNLTLSSCSGYGLTPKINVAGESTTLFGPALFRSSADSASDGYGILLATAGNESFSENTNLAASKVITAKSWDTGTTLSSSTLDTTLPVTATLTCGDCTYSRRSGDLIATVTFDFVYD